MYRHLHCLEVLKVRGVVRISSIAWAASDGRYLVFVIEFEDAVQRVVDCFLAAAVPAPAPIKYAFL